MKSRMLAGVAAVLLALVGAVITFSYGQSADQRAVAKLEPVEVLVVQTAIPAGTPVEKMASSLIAKSIPGEAVAETALKNLDNTAGKVSSVALVPGEQLLAERLVAPESVKGESTVEIPPGLQQVSFPVDPKRTVGGRLTPGEHVGIFISLDKGGIEAKPELETTQFSIHKALVTSIQNAPQEGAAPATAETKDSAVPAENYLVTVAVTDAQAAKIVFAAEFGRIWLSKEPLDAPESAPRTLNRPEVNK